MDSALKLRSPDSGGISSSTEIESTSRSSSGESQPENLGGYRGVRDRDRDRGRRRDSSLRLEMDLFAKSQSSAATSSYSSSDKYSEEYFRVMSSEKKKTDKVVLLSHENSDTTTVSSSSTEQASMVSDVTNDSLMNSKSPVQSPPTIQVMDRSGGYQPGRIPLSVFERSPGSTPVDWSIASNESLFSIPIGSISFSKDRLSKVSEGLPKSGELPQPNEATATSQLPDYDDNASDGPLAELERNFRENENAAKMPNADMINKENGRVAITEKRDDSIATRTMPSLNNDRHDRSSAVPVKKKKKKKKSTCSCSCPKPGFRWLRTICCWTNKCGCPSCSWPSCGCQCSSFNCKYKALSCCDCSCLTCCFKWTSCCDCSCLTCCFKCSSFRNCSCLTCSFKCLSCRGCSCLNGCFKCSSCCDCSCLTRCFKCSSCCDCSCLTSFFKCSSCCNCSCLTCCFKWPSCCSQGCSGCFPSRKSSCWSCNCMDSCCSCSSCCTLSFSCNFCRSSCFGCHRKCRCCC